MALLKFKGDKLSPKKKKKSSLQSSSKNEILGENDSSSVGKSDVHGGNTVNVKAGDQVDPIKSADQPLTSTEKAKTPAEKAFEQKRLLRQEQRILKQVAQTHKSKVQDFNTRLERLSEHHDIPKVGPG